MSEALRQVEGGVEITVWVVPGAARTELVGMHGDAVRIRVARPPERGEANAALVDFLTETLDFEVKLVAGSTSRRKRVLVEGGQVVEVRRRLGV